MSVGAALARTRAEGRAALIGYLPAGFPTVEASIAALHAMVAAGVDVVEVGLPYSDPVMDGPTIQRATERALAGGARTTDTFRVVEAVAETGVPTLVMTYWNPVERFGVHQFAGRIAEAGGAGLITPDLIPDEAADWVAASDEHDLDRVFLVAPSSTQQRIESREPGRDDVIADGRERMGSWHGVGSGIERWGECQGAVGQGRPVVRAMGQCRGAVRAVDQRRTRAAPRQASAVPHADGGTSPSTLQPS